MAHLIIKKTDDIWEQEQRVAKSAENILPQINLTALLKDPKKYLLGVGQAFIESHRDEIEEGARIGNKFAEDVLKETKEREV